MLESPASTVTVMIQHLGSGTSRVHLDIETDDVEAEVQRLVAAGASVVRTFDAWTVLRDPGGVEFCVVAAVAEDFREVARTVGG